MGAKGKCRASRSRLSVLAGHINKRPKWSSTQDVTEFTDPRTCNTNRVKVYLRMASGSNSTTGANKNFKHAKTQMGKIFQDLSNQVIQPCCKLSSQTLSLLVLQDTKSETSNNSSRPSIPTVAAAESTDSITGKRKRDGDCDQDQSKKKKGQDEELKDFQKQLEECHQKTQAIMPILERDTMKAVVFGPISSGKSTMINAILGEDGVLPTGMGVCSSCLVQIEGCEAQEPYITLPDGSQRPIQDLEKLANTLESEHLQAGDTVVVHWPKSKCILLNNDTQIIDRPGNSSDPEVDKIVNDKCADADVHVFVVDSVAAITTESRDYFISVAQKLSKPNIFFVFNKWDESADTKKPEKVQQQHINAANELLKKVQEEFDRKKVFFVSAKEVLLAKTDQAGLKKGHQNRTEEFNDFWNELEKSISVHAIKTKFGPHCNEGIALCDRLDGLAQSILDCLDHAMEEWVQRRKSLTQQNNQLKEKQKEFENKCKKMIGTTQTKMKDTTRKIKEDSITKLRTRLGGIWFEEDQKWKYEETVLEAIKANDTELHDAAIEAFKQGLKDVKRDMETNMKDCFGDSIDYTATLTTDGNTTLVYEKDKTLSDTAEAGIKAGLKRKVYSLKSKVMTAVGVTGLVAGAVAAFLFPIAAVPLVASGGSAIHCANTSESNSQAKEVKTQEYIMKKYKMGLNSKELQLPVFNKQAEDIAIDFKATFNINEKVASKIKTNNERISVIDDLKKQLEDKSHQFRTCKEHLKNVKKQFQEFQCSFLIPVPPPPRL